MFWCFDGVFDDDGVVSEESISTNAKRLMGGYIVVNIIRGETGVSVVSVDVVGEFGLIHNSLSEVATPLNKVGHMMLDHETVCGHMVTVDDDADVAGVASISYSAIDVVISTPEPGVVNDCSVSVDDNHGSYAGWSNLLMIWPTSTNINIRHNAWKVRIALVLHDAPSEEDTRLDWTGFEEETGDADVVDVGDFDTWPSCRGHKRSHTKTKEDGALLVDFE